VVVNYLDLTDEQVLAEVGNFGPGFVGQYLFERAEYLRVVALNNTLGPDARSHEFVPSEAAMKDLEARGMVKALEVEVAQTEAQPVKRGPGRPRKEK